METSACPFQGDLRVSEDSKRLSNIWTPLGYHECLAPITRCTEKDGGEGFGIRGLLGILAHNLRRKRKKTGGGQDKEEKVKEEKEKRRGCKGEKNF